MPLSQNELLENLAPEFSDHMRCCIVLAGESELQRPVEIKSFRFNSPTRIVNYMKTFMRSFTGAADSLLFPCQNMRPGPHTTIAQMVCPSSHPRFTPFYQMGRILLQRRDTLILPEIIDMYNPAVMDLGAELTVSADDDNYTYAVNEKKVLSESLFAFRHLATAQVTSFQNSARFRIRQNSTCRANGHKVIPRGLGLDCVKACFVCGATNRFRAEKPQLLNNISMMLTSYADAREIAACLENLIGADAVYLDFRKSEPTYIQIKIGACNAHLYQLRKLNYFLEQFNCFSEQEILKLCTYSKPPTMDLTEFQSFISMFSATTQKLVAVECLNDSDEDQARAKELEKKFGSFGGTTHIVFDLKTEAPVALFNVQGLGTPDGNISGINYMEHWGYNLTVQQVQNMIDDCYFTILPTP